MAGDSRWRALSFVGMALLVGLEINAIERTGQIGAAFPTGLTSVKG
jgi:hypothetical protein